MRWSTAIVLLFLSTLPSSFANNTYFNKCVCAVPRYHPFTCQVPSIDDHTCPGDIEPLPAIPLVGPTVDDTSIESEASALPLIPETFSPPLEPSPTPKTMQSTDSSSFVDPSLPLTSSSVPVPASSPESQQGTPGIFLSFEEWRKRLFEIESKKPRKRVNTGGKGKGRQQIIDSLDGGLGDDVGSLFERHDYDTPQAFYESKQLSAIIPEKGSVDGLAAPAANPAADTDASTYANSRGEYVQPPPGHHAAAESSSSSPVARPSGSSAAKPRSDNINLLKKLKERYNYASIDCAATVLSVNREARGASTILYESKDRYMLNECSAHRFVIVSLCESILIDTIVMANYEFFSSTFKDFRVWVAEQYPPEEQVPPKAWELLGQWRARNTRDVQIFDVPNQEKWWRYIKVEFLSHHSHEHFCPLSLLRVHGSPQMEFFNLYEKPTMSDANPDDDDSDDEEPSVTAEEPAIQDRLLPAELEARMNQTGFVLPPIKAALWIPEDTEAFLAELMARETEETGGSGEQHQEGELGETERPAGVTAEGVDDMQLQQQDHFMRSPPSAPSVGGQPDVAPPASTDVAQGAECEGEECAAAVSHHDEKNDTAVTPLGPGSVTADPSAPTTSAIATVSANESSDHGTALDVPPSLVASPANLKQQPIEEPVIATTIATTTTTTMTTTITPPSSPSTTAPSDDAQLQKLFLNAYNPPPTGTGESIYKTIMKRLGMLELNVTLSQRYLEEQNKMLHGVFTRMEQTHREQMHMLAGHLNETGALRVEALKRRYELQREETISEIKELSTKLHMMADQLVFEKRLTFVQLILLVCLFVFIAMTRGTLNAFSPIVVAQTQERRRREAVAAAVHASSPPKDSSGVLITADAVKNTSAVESVTKFVELKQREPETMVAADVETKVAADVETKVTADAETEVAANVERKAETEARRAEERWKGTNDSDTGREMQTRTQVQAQDGSDQYEAVVPVAQPAVGPDSHGEAEEVQPEQQQRLYNHARQESEVTEDLSNSIELPAQPLEGPDKSMTPPPKSPDGSATPPPKSPDGSITSPPPHHRDDHAFDARDDDVPLLENELVPHPDVASFARRYHERMAKSEEADRETGDRVEATGEQHRAVFLPSPFEDREKCVEAELRTAGADAGAGVEVGPEAQISGGVMRVDNHELPVTPSALLERAEMAMERFELRGGEERIVPEQGWPGL